MQMQMQIADKDYDSQIICDKGETLGMNVIIPRKKNSIKGNKGLDWGCISSGIWWRTRLSDSSIIGPSPLDMTN